jgi:hypothetical protein
MTSHWSADGAKLLWWDGKTMRFDLTRDPAEASPETVDTPDASFEAQVDRYLRHLAETSDVQQDPETVKALKELGYLQ